MIFNTDETGCSTVTNPPKVIAERGSIQIGQVTSAERGTLITTLFFVNTSGFSLPPVLVFPRVNYKILYKPMVNQESSIWPMYPDG